MTCIVGYTRENKTYIGGDSAAICNGIVQSRVDTKVFNNNEMIFGYTSSFRMGQLLRYKLEVPKHDQSITDHEYLCTSFIDSVIKCFKDNGYNRDEESVVIGGNFLIGYKGQLYNVDSDYHVGITYEPYQAIGSGWEVALGALEVGHSLCLPPKEVVERALRAASKLTAYVRPPYTILALDKDGKFI